MVLVMSFINLAVQRIYTVLLLLLSIFVSSLYGNELPMRLVLPILPTRAESVAPTAIVEAEALYREAVAAVEAKEGSRAMRLALDAIRKDPNHEKIRILFGFQLHEGNWRTTWEIERLKQGFVDHPEFGWIAAAFVPRYESGERHVTPNRWVSIEQEAALRREMRHGWRIASEHYDICTNHSLEQGVRTVRELEHLYRAWKFLFFDFLFTDEELVLLFRGRVGGVAPPRHEVFLYRDKKDYVDNLKGLDPMIARSDGYYFPKRSRAYFFPVAPDMDPFNAEVVRKTLFHEGTHQLFQETRSLDRVPGQRGNFWVLEGIAMLMETLRIENDHYVLGDAEDQRLYAAKVHKMRHGFYVPFTNIVRMNGSDFQSHPQVVRLYSQSAGMTHFLMFAQEGKYRPAVVTLLRQMYDGTDRADSLSKLTGRSLKELDEEYEKFLNLVPD